AAGEGARIAVEEEQPRAGIRILHHPAELPRAVRPRDVDPGERKRWPPLTERPSGLEDQACLLRHQPENRGDLTAPAGGEEGEHEAERPEASWGRRRHSTASIASANRTAASADIPMNKYGSLISSSITMNRPERSTPSTRA